LAEGDRLRLGVYLQNSAGLLDAEQLFAVPYASAYNSHGLAIGDINSDGKPDVALADYNHGLVVLTKGFPPPPFRISRMAIKPNGLVTLTVPCRGSNDCCAIEFTDSLTNWVQIGIMQECVWTDTNLAIHPKRFYRAVMQ